MKIIERIKKIFNIKDKNLNKSITPNIIILVLVAVLLIIISDSFSDSKPIFSSEEASTEGETKQVLQVTENNENDVEAKLKEILEKIEGVGEVVVMINFEGGEEQVPAINVNDSTSLTEENDGEGGKRNTTQNNDGKTVVIINGENGDEPLILKKISPAVQGVCVVAEGASNDLIKLQIEEAVITLFGITQNKVTVYPMKS